MKAFGPNPSKSIGQGREIKQVGKTPLDRGGSRQAAITRTESGSTPVDEDINSKSLYSTKTTLPHEKLFPFIKITQVSMTAFTQSSFISCLYLLITVGCVITLL